MFSTSCINICIFCGIFISQIQFGKIGANFTQPHAGLGATESTLVTTTVSHFIELYKTPRKFVTIRGFTWRPRRHIWSWEKYSTPTARDDVHIFNNKHSWPRARRQTWPWDMSSTTDKIRHDIKIRSNREEEASDENSESTTNSQSNGSTKSSKTSTTTKKTSTTKKKPKTPRTARPIINPLDPLYEIEEFSPFPNIGDTADSEYGDVTVAYELPLADEMLIEVPFPYGCIINSTSVGCAGVCPETCEYRSTYCVPLCGPPCQCKPGLVYNIQAKACTLIQDCPAGIKKSTGGIYRVFQ